MIYTLIVQRYDGLNKYTDIDECPSVASCKLTEAEAHRITAALVRQHGMPTHTLMTGAAREGADRNDTVGATRNAWRAGEYYITITHQKEDMILVAGHEWQNVRDKVYDLLKEE